MGQLSFHSSALAGIPSTYAASIAVVSLVLRGNRTTCETARVDAATPHRRIHIYARSISCFEVHVSSYLPVFFTLLSSHAMLEMYW